MRSDRILGLVVVVAALAYLASAAQIQTSFFSDPLGPRAFPYLVGGLILLCGLVFIIRPDPSPAWPGARSWAALAIAAAVLVAYAFALKPLGFLVPTAVAGAILSYQIRPRLLPAVFAGCGLSVGLFAVFKFILGLSLFAFPRGLIGA
jgi:putative tricarboxylic transport membrane protein